MKSSKFPIYLIEKQLSSNSIKSFTIEDQKKLGEKKFGKIIYSPYEALFLIEKNDAEIISKDKPLIISEIIKLFSKECKNFYSNYLVFKHLRNKGYIVKEGLKFGGEFRVYEQYKLSHAKYICLVTNTNIDLKNLIASTRITHSTGKKLLLAVVDKEEDVLFYEIDWKKI
jgi:tRNA-intron endonuclease